MDRWIDVDLQALRQNAQAVRGLLGPQTALLAVVKANGYGLGAPAVARALEGLADMFAVTTVEEALELREGGLARPILVFLPPTAENAALYFAHDLSATVDSAETLAMLAKTAAADGGRPLSCHLKVNLGMNRFGVKTKEALELAKRLADAPGLRFEGMYGHLPNAANDETGTRSQIERFSALAEQLRGLQICPPFLHVANSAAIIKYPQSHFTMVRAGTVLYGQSPCPLPPGFSLRETFFPRCRIAAVRQVQKGEPVGYGGDQHMRHAGRLAVIPVGYFDGFGMFPPGRNNFGGILRRFFTDWARLLLKRPLYYALYNGQKLPVVGRVAMQTAMVDISACPQLQKGDTIDFYLRRTAASPAILRRYVEEREKESATE